MLAHSARARDDLPHASPEFVGVSSARLGRIDEAIQRQIDERRISGAVSLVARKGMVVQHKAYGVRDIDSKAPMTLDTIFRMASSTKPVTGVAVLMLIEQGKLHLDDPASQFIPELKGLKVAEEREGKSELVPAAREITVRDLLTHTSGLGSGGLGMRGVTREALWAREGETLAEMMTKLSKLSLDFQPGTKWRYSGLAGIDVLARIVEVASGQKFDEFLHLRIFEPAGMTDTFFHVPEDRQNRLATIYQAGPNGLEKNKLQLRFPKTYFSGAGGLASTAADYYRFGQMLLDRGLARDGHLLSPRSVELLSANQVGEMFEGQAGRPKGMGFGFTVEVVVDSAQAGTYRSDGSFGWDGAFGTHFWVDPKEELVAVLMIQTSAGRAIHRDFETAVLQAIVQ